MAGLSFLLQSGLVRKEPPRLLVNGAHAVLLRSKAAKVDPWLLALRGRRPRLVVAVALANKTARIAWAIMSKQDTYRRTTAAA